jgi:hypothetical protein
MRVIARWLVVQTKRKKGLEFERRCISDGIMMGIIKTGKEGGKERKMAKCCFLKLPNAVLE